MAGHGKHQGLIAEVERFRYATVDDVLQTAAGREEAPLFALVDGVEDPHNLGAIIRSADAAGVHGILIPRDRSASVTSVVEKTAAGATAHVHVVQVTNLVRTMEQLKKQGIWMFGADLEGQQDLWGTDFSGPAGIVMGGEDRGLRRLVRETCDFLITIPMFGKMSSLNVSVAAGVVFFEAARQRRGTQKGQP
jgi:23S rRNA (guanosine2251-2'-O)-methyltransferase